MAIKFDTMDELKAFYKNFQLSEGKASGKETAVSPTQKKSAKITELPERKSENPVKKRGRKAKPDIKTAEASKKTRATQGSVSAVKKPAALKKPVKKPEAIISKPETGRKKLDGTPKARPGRKPGISAKLPLKNL